MERHIYSIVFEHLADQEFLSAAQYGGFALENLVTARVNLSQHPPTHGKWL